MIKVGLTGGIGSGKSIVAQILEAMEYPVFYSDDQAKYISDNDPEVRQELLKIFGEEVYHQTGLNRSFLAERIFGNDSLRQKVNQIIHPRVREAFRQFCDKQSVSLVFNEAAILIETGAYQSFDATVLVCAPEDLRVRRVQERDGASEEAIRQRIKKQWSDDRKREFSDFEIINDEHMPLLAQVEEMLYYLTSSQGS